VAPHQIVLFLELVKDARRNGLLAFRGTRDKNVAALAAYGLVESEVLDAVAALEPEQAMALPRPNEHPVFAHERICEFGLDLGRDEFYVKVTAGVTTEGAAGCVISFHAPERAIDYPYSNQRRERSLT
jgi:hypothetical protein